MVSPGGVGARRRLLHADGAHVVPHARPAPRRLVVHLRADPRGRPRRASRIGGGIYARTKVPATLRWFAITCSLEALFIAIPYARRRQARDRHAPAPPARARRLRREHRRRGRLVAGFVVLPAAIVSGIQFPLVIGLYGRGSSKVGRDVGAAYLANTIGSIVGSLAGGFGLIPLLGAVGSWKLVVVSLSIGATVAPHDGRSRDAAGVVERGGPLDHGLRCRRRFSSPSARPHSWRHSGIGAGRADAADRESRARLVPVWMRMVARDVRWEEDGLESSVALDADVGLHASSSTASPTATSLIDAPTQVMSGRPRHAAPRPCEVGARGRARHRQHGRMARCGPDASTGSTSSSSSQRSCVSRATAAPVNERVLDNPKVHIHLADAREYLRTTRPRTTSSSPSRRTPIARASRACTPRSSTVRRRERLGSRRPLRPVDPGVRGRRLGRRDRHRHAAARSSPTSRSGRRWAATCSSSPVPSMHASTSAGSRETRHRGAVCPRGARRLADTSSARGRARDTSSRAPMLADILTKNELRRGQHRRPELPRVRVRAQRRALAQRGRRAVEPLAPACTRAHPRSTARSTGRESRRSAGCSSSTPIAPLAPSPQSYTKSKLGLTVRAFNDDQFAVSLSAWKVLARPAAEVSYGETLLVAECAARAGTERRPSARRACAAPAPRRVSRPLGRSP